MTTSVYLPSFSLCFSQPLSLLLFNLHDAFCGGNHTKIHFFHEAHSHGRIIRGATFLLLSDELGMDSMSSYKMSCI